MFLLEGSISRTLSPLNPAVDAQVAYVASHGRMSSLHSCLTVTNSEESENLSSHTGHVKWTS